MKSKFLYFFISQKVSHSIEQKICFTQTSIFIMILDISVHV